MRPDTETHPIQKRIMAGAAVITAVVGFGYALVLLAQHYRTVTLAIAWIVTTAVLCYMVGDVALAFTSD